MDHLQKNKERIPSFSNNIYQTELDKACFQQGMAYGDFNNLTR